MLIYNKDKDKERGILTISTQNKPTITKPFEIWYADIPKDKKDTRRQSGIRPVLIYCNEMCNKHSDYITIIPFTTKFNKRQLPTHVNIEGFGLDIKSTLICEQINGLSKNCLLNKVGEIDNEDVKQQICKAVNIQMFDIKELISNFNCYIDMLGVNIIVNALVDKIGKANMQKYVR